MKKLILEDMNIILPGQRFFSKAESELGVGRVRSVEFKNVTLDFPAVKETRTYRIGTVLERYTLSVGEMAKNEKGNISFPIVEIKEEKGLLVYCGRGGKKLKESEISSKLYLQPSSYFENLSRNQVDSTKEYRLREQGQQLSLAWRSSPVRGMIGARVDMVPHQFYLCSRACSSSELPRLMLSDEVGLGKTIEAGMIWHTLQARGRITRTLILVPESLKHQWLVEMRRRFNKVFTLVDQAFLKSLSETRENISMTGSTVFMKMNPFLATNTAICTMEFLMQNPPLAEDLKAVTWDLMIVDEAHHLQCEDDWVSKEYRTVYDLVSKTKGLLLLTGTPLQLNPESHFHRLRMLDAARFYDYEKFLQEEESYKKIAADLSKLPDSPNTKLAWNDLDSILPKNSPIRKWLSNETEKTLDASEWVRRIVDAMGTGSVVFRNTRKGVGSFPKRLLKEVALEPDGEYRKLVRALCEKNPEKESDYNVNGALLHGVSKANCRDERVVWLKQFLKGNGSNKVLLITEDDMVLRALAAEIAVEFGASYVTCFFEQMSIEDRDRASALFARADGATILISTEIGSEGRNFQFAHQLILWDLPLDATLVEQRIGRLDRIGQTQDVEIYVPYVKGSGQEVLFRWYADGLDAFSQPLMNGSEFFIKYTEVLVQTLCAPEMYLEDFKKKFIPKLRKESSEVRKLAEKGRDRLLEFNSRNPEAASEIIQEIQRIDADSKIPEFVLNALQMQGVDNEKGSLENTVVLTQGSQVEDGSIPGMPSTGNTLLMTEESVTQKSVLSVTLSRETAMLQDGVEFLSVEHPLAQGAMDYATSGRRGSVSCVLWDNSGCAGNMLMEYAFVLECSISPEWGLDDVAGSKYERILLNGAGEDFSKLAKDLETATLRDTAVPQGNRMVNAKLEYFSTVGFEQAKRLAQNAANYYAEQMSAAVEEKLEAEYRRAFHLNTMRGTSEQTSNLAEMKKNMQERKKAASQMAIRLDAIRLIVCR